MQSDNNKPATSLETTPINPGGDVVFKDEPKKNTGMIVGMIILALFAIIGIGFGIWAYLDGNQKTSNLDNQISDLKNQLAEKDSVIAEQETMNSTSSDDDSTSVVSSNELNGDIALDLLQEATVGKQVGYSVGYANVHAKCDIDGEELYIVDYANSRRINEDFPQFGRVLFKSNGNGGWDFDLSATTDFNDDFMANCTVLHGNK